MLRILDTEPPRARDYFPLYDGVAPGAVAARSYLAARAGDFNEALDLLAIVAAAAPTRTWTAAGWLDLPGIAEQVEPAAAAESLLSLALHLDEPIDPAGRKKRSNGSIAPFRSTRRTIRHSRRHASCTTGPTGTWPT